MFFLFLLQAFCSGDYLDFNPNLKSSSCPSYSCSPPKASRPSPTTCIWPNATSSYYLYPCSSGTTCNLTSYQCQASIVTEQLSFVGEPCKASSNCYISTCVNSTCRGLGINKSCSSNYQCDIGLRCSSSNNTCQPQLLPGQTGCKSYLDCVNWATCNKTTTNNKGTCVGYSSVPLGSIVSDCSGGFSYMCKMGSCGKTSLFSNLAVCTYPAISNFPLPKTCTADTQCLGTSGGQTVTSTCGCGINPFGQSYCEPFLGDLPGKNMIATWNAALKLAGKCNTARRSSDACMKMIGLYKNTTQATLGFYSYSLYQNNDECIKSILTDDYWLDYSKILVAQWALLLGLLS